jgi:aspartyl-tRNA(Asn)/glutamyl-tRNA(Gln) amidotransferase subunit C
MALDKATVAHIAQLARIEVPDEDLAALADELGAIIGWVEMLGEVDATDVEPMTGVGGFALPERADSVADGGYADRVLANAPERIDDFFTVPKVVE